jgi:hypothetical protein
MGVTKVVDDVLKQIPAPDGWRQRHVCFISDEADKSLCLFFPYPA